MQSMVPLLFTGAKAGPGDLVALKELCAAMDKAKAHAFAICYLHQTCPGIHAGAAHGGWQTEQLSILGSPVLINPVNMTKATFLCMLLVSWIT
ncbi:uncharacterized protein ACA1_338780 [Acanthamoeba castellanii str. Neff]|uniref:Uncharacterized protein n=1 Tax=Acanthamoeba castellanii (strain ATCC 30010 / Neff) TaxID=1257118 RepID=L8H6K9_ACACF|nr:uncharacterized protein ACA1_338780 [Acanthamoeba castellanii str. Neff]ELR20388.1 hypothetical protein ACA1_338780 [Acanthamoeba castellanii str. Neff]